MYILPFILNSKLVGGFWVNSFIQWHIMLNRILVNVDKDIPKSHISSLERHAVVELKVREAALKQGSRGFNRWRKLWEHFAA